MERERDGERVAFWRKPFDAVRGLARVIRERRENRRLGTPEERQIVYRWLYNNLNDLFTIYPEQVRTVNEHRREEMECLSLPVPGKYCQIERYQGLDQLAATIRVPKDPLEAEVMDRPSQEWRFVLVDHDKLHGSIVYTLYEPGSNPHVEYHQLPAGSVMELWSELSGLEPTDISS